MNKKLNYLLIIVVVAALVVPVFNSVTAMKKSDEDKIARNIATLLIAGRRVIAQQQGLFNDPKKGDKGFTPAIFESKIVPLYKKFTGVDLKKMSNKTLRGKYLLALLASAKETVGDYQKVINEKGKGFKGFVPAVFGKETGKKFFAKTGIQLKQTSLRHRALYNKPDPFEEKSLKRFESKKWPRGRDLSKVNMEKGKKVIRFMQPIYIKKACLKCHGVPKGELDISGRPKEGYKLGEIRGAISVRLPVGK